MTNDNFNLDIFSNADDEIIDTLAERYYAVPKRKMSDLYEKSEKLYDNLMEKRCYIAGDVVSGVEVYRRPKWKRNLKFGIAAAAIVIGSSGTLYALKSFDRNPENYGIAALSSLTSEQSENTTGTSIITDYEANSDSQKLYKIGQEMTGCDNWEYTVASVRLTKSNRGMTFRQNEDFPCDENGVFTCDYSYIIADITVTNTSSEDREYYTNSSTLYFYNYKDNGEIDWLFPDAGAEVYDFNGGKFTEQADFFVCDIKAGESKNYRIGYKIEDKYLDDNYDLIILDFDSYTNVTSTALCLIEENKRPRDIAPIKEYDMSTKDGIYFKMLNSLDYYNKVSGKLIVNSSYTEDEQLIDFTSDLISSKSYSTIYNSKTSDPEVVSAENADSQVVCDGTDYYVYYSDGDKVWTHHYPGGDRSCVGNALHKYDYKPIDDDNRHTTDSNGNDYWNYSTKYTNLQLADTYLSPQEIAFSFLSDKDNWEIKGEECFSGRECIVIEGILNGELSAKLNVTSFTIYVDKQTGVLLRYIGMNSRDSVSDYMIMLHIEFDTVLSSSESRTQLYADSEMKTEVKYDNPDYPENQNGLTYGADKSDHLINIKDRPDLQLVVGDNGIEGYCYKKDLFDFTTPSSPEEALRLQEERKNTKKIINVYKDDGKTIIGTFTMRY